MDDTALSLVREAMLSRDGDVRLVFADWLEEHGQEEWAELVRVCCKLAQVKHAFAPSLKADDGRFVLRFEGSLNRPCRPPYCKQCRPLKALRKQLKASLGTQERFVVISEDKVLFYEPWYF